MQKSSECSSPEHQQSFAKTDRQGSLSANILCVLCVLSPQGSWRWYKAVHSTNKDLYATIGSHRLRRIEKQAGMLAVIPVEFGFLSSQIILPDEMIFDSVLKLWWIVAFLQSYEENSMNEMYSI